MIPVFHHFGLYIISNMEFLFFFDNQLVYLYRPTRKYTYQIMMTIAWVPKAQRSKSSMLRGPILVTGVRVWRSRRPLDFKSWNIWSFLKRKSFSRLRWRCTVRSAPSPGLARSNFFLEIILFCCQVSPGKSIEGLWPLKPKLRRTVTVSIEKEALKKLKPRKYKNPIGCKARF